jgi:hypothetical protein
MTHVAEPNRRLKGIETHIRVQHLDGPCGFPSVRHDMREAMVNEIRIERKGSLEFRNRVVVLVPEN